MLTLQTKRGSTAALNYENPVLAVGEIGYDTTLKQIKIGDGVTAWKSLPWLSKYVYSISDITGLETRLTTIETSFVPLAQRGVANGVATLDGGGKVPATQLPSYVDDVLEFANFASLPGTGETSKIYITLDDNKTYRWTGTVYVVITASPGTTDEVPEGSTNLYFTNDRAKSATALVEYTLTTMPGYGVVPDAVVADYTALDAYVGTNHWVEVTSGANSQPELFRIEFGQTLGPMPSWFKNPKYTLGDNGEDVVVINIADFTLFDGFNNTISSKWVDPQKSDADNINWRILRASRAIPIFIPTSMPVGSEKAVFDTTGKRVICIGVGYMSGSTVNTVYETGDPQASTIALQGRSRCTFYAPKGTTLVDPSKYEGLAGIPARYTTNDMDNESYMTIWGSTSHGMIGWDFNKFSLENLTDLDVTVGPGKTTGALLGYNETTSKWETSNPSDHGIHVPGGGLEGQIIVLQSGVPTWANSIGSNASGTGERQVYGPLGGSQTVFNINYQIGPSGAELDVYVQGHRLNPNEYTASNGTSVTLNNPALAGEYVVLVAGGIAPGVLLKSYKETIATPVSAAGTLTVDCNNGNVFTSTLTENVTIAFANVPTGGAYSITMVLTQDATGGRTITWPASVKWPGGSAPTMSTAANKVDIVTAVTPDAGVTWYGFVGGVGY